MFIKIHTKKGENMLHFKDQSNFGYLQVNKIKFYHPKCWPFLRSLTGSASAHLKRWTTSLSLQQLTTLPTSREIWASVESKGTTTDRDLLSRRKATSCSWTVLLVRATDRFIIWPEWCPEQEQHCRILWTLWQNSRLVVWNSAWTIKTKLKVEQFVK